MGEVLCRSCGAKIIFLKTKNGKNMPVNFVEGMNVSDTFDSTKMVSHFSTCLQASSWRRG